MTSPTRRIRLHAETTADGRGLAELRRDLEKAAKGADNLDASLRKVGEDDGGAGGVGSGLAKTLRKQARSGVMAGVGDAFGSIPSKLRGIAIAGIVTAVGFAAPALGAMIAGAVTGAAGLGGIVGGIFAASKSPAVRQAASLFASNISSAFFQMGDEFVEPLVDAFKILEQGFHDLHLEAAFEKVAPYINDLAYGLAGFGRNFMSGFTRALEKAGPVLEVLGRELPRVGTALGYMFEKMASSEGTVQGMLFLLGVLEATFKGIGNVLSWLGDRFVDWNNFVSAVSGFAEDIPLIGGPFKRINDLVDDFTNKANVGRQVLNYLGRQLGNTAGQAQATADAINKLNDEMFEQQNLMLAASNATLAYEGNLIRLNQQVKEHGTDLRRNTEAGNQNRQTIDSLIGGLHQILQAEIAAAEGDERRIDAAKAKYNQQIADLQRVLIKLGFEKKAIAEIIGQYKNIPRRITIDFIQRYHQEGVPLGEHTGPRIGDTRGRQHGGPVLPGVPYRINEAGSETVTFPANGRVHPAHLTPMAGNARPLHITVSGSRAVQILLDELVREIGNRGGTLAAIGIREN